MAALVAAIHAAPSPKRKTSAWLAGRMARRRQS
jgi:hypothetical protein